MQKAIGENFNGNWQFKKQEDEHWQSVQIPHDWLIYDTKNLYKTGVGLYRKYFDLPNDELCQRFFLRFDGIYMDATLHINGQKAGEWKNGYTAFTQEITDYVKPGTNEVTVTVDYKNPNTRWYSGAGIYRDCWLVVKNAAHFAIDGVYVTPQKRDNSDDWVLDVDAEVVAPEGMECEIRHQVLYNEHVVSDVLTISKPNVWTTWDTREAGVFPLCCDHSNFTAALYTLKSTLIANGKVSDTVCTRFGFRQISYTTTDGFLLNNKRLQFNGVCQHHDLGGLGSAVYRPALRRQLQTLKSMGVNAIRTAHNPPAAALMELADEMGFVVMSELTDMWKRPKTSYDYARFFDEWVERDVAAWVRRDRNCPSLIMWSIGNEIHDTHVSYEDGAATMRRLMQYVQDNDPKIHAPVTFCTNYMWWENTQKCADIIKLIGYNYSEGLYHDHHQKHTSWIIYGGETSSTVQSRGIYHFPLSESILADDDLQCSSLGNSRVNWGARSSEGCIIDHRDASFSLGQFLWTGTDYIGEPTPYSTKNSYFGQIDTAGFAKDSFYVYKSAWVPMEHEPFVHLFPYWDHSPGQPVDVRIASNCAKVELFLNSKSLGVQEIDHANGQELLANYIVPYEPGVLKAVAYGADGAIIAEQERRSFGDAVALKLDNTVIDNFIFTEVSAVDVNGNPVENATNRVRVSVKNGELVALDNGDSSDYEQYRGTNSRRLFSGKLLVISKGECVAISAEIDFTDTPIRKIEIVQTENDPYTLTAKIHPANGTYPKIDWCIATAGGIPSPLGTLDISDCCLTATINPVADGIVYVRATANNGNDHPSLISTLPIQISGCGIPSIDPYTFTAGGLYTHTNKPMGNGIEHGVATMRGENHIGYANVDFGKFGSDEFTMGIHPFEGDPLPIDIWLGMPGEPGARKLDTVTYNKGVKWGFYQDFTIKLPERIAGVQTLCFAVDNRQVYIKGFQFAGKAYAKIPFAANDSIYGDNFAVCGDAVENIGNNVSITFDEMDFATPAGEIEISWRSALDISTIRVVFAPENGAEVVNMLTLPDSESYTSKKLPLQNPIVGKGSLSFIFLPGSDINLQWFKFEMSCC